MNLKHLRFLSGLAQSAMNEAKRLAPILLKHKADLEKDLEQLRDTEKKAGLLLGMIRQFATGWKTERLGKKSHQSWFLVSDLEIRKQKNQGHCSISYTPVFAEELVDDLDQARIGRSDKQIKSKTYPVNLIKFDQATHYDCPCCQESGLAIVGLVKMDDSPDGDWWETSVYVICPSTSKIMLVKRQIHR